MWRLMAVWILASLLLPAQTVSAAPPIPASVRPLETYANGGSLIERSFFSPALGQEISYRLFLPPDYDASRQRYPSLYLLHGLDASPEQWPFLGVGTTADEMIAAGDIEPLVIIFPFGANSYYLNEPENGLRWADHVAQDVRQDVDRGYRTLRRARSRAIGGLSMGGDAALRFGLTYPSTFGVVGAHSPSTRLTYTDTPGIFADEEAFNVANPLWLIRNEGVPGNLRIWIDVGDGDPWWWSAEALSEALAERGIRHDFHYYVGEHDDTYWAAHVRDYLQFYDSALRE